MWRWFSDVLKEASGKSSDIFFMFEGKHFQNPEAGQNVSGWSQRSGELLFFSPVLPAPIMMSGY